MGYIIIGEVFTFPEGDASTNRVYTYAKGLKENGVNLHVVCFRNEYTDFGDGLYNGINYYHPFRQKKKSKYFLVRTTRKVLKYVRTLFLLRKINKKDKIQAIIVYSMLPGTFLFSWFISVITRSKLLLEVSEHPLRRYDGSPLRRRLGQIKLKTETNIYDGIFCISDYLVRFYTNLGMAPDRLLLVPSTVDPARFIRVNGKPFQFTYIGYFGGLTFIRDNVDILIKAFALISEKHQGINLVMGGFGANSDRRNIMDLIASLGITGRAILLDYLPREEVVRYLVNSHVLVMVRANDEKTRASFPSKLTEYLASARPVISVDVGEISKFLTDGVNSFLVEPGDIRGLADKIDKVLTNYEKALEIAEKGKLLTETIFNYNYQARRIISFVNSLYETTKNHII